MCNKCKNKKCGGCGSDNSGATAQMQNQIDILNEQVGDLLNATKFLNGHPILEIQSPDDIAMFDPTTKLGAGNWEGWAMCVGNVHPIPGTNSTFTTPNLIDKFIVMAGGSYAVNATGGAATVQLTAAQNGQHSHVVTDPGHTHVVTDPGHSHGVTDPGHTHTGTAAAHVHTFTTGNAGNHNHSVPELTDLVSDGGTGATAANDPVGLGNSGIAGDHNHSGTTDSAGSVLTVDANPTGVSFQDAFTGNTNESAETGVTIADSGLGDPHENLPPYYALIFVQKIF